MLRLSILATAALLASATSAGAESSGCTQVANLSAARLTWAALRKDRVDPAHSEESCLSYAQNFFSILLIPMLYVVFQTMREKKKRSPRCPTCNQPNDL